MSVRTYGQSVLVGNWSEDMTLDEDLLKDFNEKRDRGELLIQKSSNMKKNILRKTDLSVSKDGLLHFGDVVMLLNPENVVESMSNTSPIHGNYTLSVNPDELAVYTTGPLKSPCGVTASSNLNSYERNSFIISSVDGSEIGEILHYGQNFALRTSEGFMGHLYLTSDQTRLGKSSKKSCLQEASLTDQFSYQACWQTVFPDPQMRMEHEGLPVPANTKLLLRHSKTNQCLAVLRKYIVRTIFGKEQEIAVHTFFNAHKVEENDNHWIIVTCNPSDETDSMLDRPDPLCKT